METKKLRHKKDKVFSDQIVTSFVTKKSIELTFFMTKRRKTHAHLEVSDAESTVTVTSFTTVVVGDDENFLSVTMTSL